MGMNGQIDWQAQQISHLVCSLAGQRCSEAWGTFSTRTSQSITALIAWRKEEWRKEAADIQSSKVENDLCSTRQILALFRGQPWGDSWETGRSAYGPFRALRCHLSATHGVTVSMSAFLACHQCYCTGSSLAWGLNLRVVVCGIFWSSSPGVFSGYSGFLPSFIGFIVQPIK